MMRLPALLAGGLLSLLAASAPQPLAAEETAKTAAKEAEAPAVPPGQKPSATLELASDQVRLIMGGTAGKGTLHFEGTDYPFTFKTASASVGAKVVTKVTAVGEVYNLEKIEDFAGEYTSASKSAMAGSAEVRSTYKNDKGVVVEVHGSVQGAGLSFGGGMATITLVRK